MADVNTLFASSGLAADTITDAFETAIGTVGQTVTAAERYEKALRDAVTQVEHTRSSGFSPDELVSHAERISRERSLTEIEVLQGIQFALLAVSARIAGCVSILAAVSLTNAMA